MTCQIHVGLFLGGGDPYLHTYGFLCILLCSLRVAIVTEFGSAMEDSFGLEVLLQVYLLLSFPRDCKTKQAQLSHSRGQDIRCSKKWNTTNFHWYISFCITGSKIFILHSQSIECFLNASNVSNVFRKSMEVHLTLSWMLGTRNQPK